MSKAGEEGSGGGGGVVWIGRHCWPQARALVTCGDHGLLEQSLFVDPLEERGRVGASRVWAIDLALHSHSVCAVVADGSGLDMASTRRLQLAARSCGGFCLLLRPESERKALSAAQTRWGVRPAPTEERRARWMIDLLRRKGPLSASAWQVAGMQFLLEWDHEACAVVMVSGVGGALRAKRSHEGAA